MAWRVLFELHIRGSNLSPDAVPVSDLVDILDSLDKALRALLSHEQQRDFRLSLVELEAGSTVLGFTANLEQEARTAFGSIVDAVRDKRVHDLPGRVHRFIDSATEFAKRHKAAIGLATSEEREPDAWIDPESVLQLATPAVKGETVLYGTVVRAGGKAPKIGLELDSGEFLPCPAPRDVVVRAGGRLYERVGVKGVAEWDTYDWAIKSFRVTELVDYAASKLTDAAAKVRRVAGPRAWSAVTDVVKAIEELRRGAEADDSLP